MISPKETIEQALKKGKISGSWLVSGMKGTGRKTFVRGVCHLLTTGQWPCEAKMPDTMFHPDIKWIEYALTQEAQKEIQKEILAGKSISLTDETWARKKEITINEIRSGIQFLSMKPGQGHYRILVIASADDMNENASNALLKILEEPYPGSVIFLISENPGRLLPTIRSRCRTITLEALSKEKLIQLIQNEMPDVPDPVLLAELSAGSIGLAQELAQNDGIALYHQLVSFLPPHGMPEIDLLETFTETLAKDEKSFELVKILLLNELAKRARQCALLQEETAEKWIDLFNESNILFKDIKVLYLDKKQTLKTLFFKFHRMFHD